MDRRRKEGAEAWDGKEEEKTSMEEEAKTEEEERRKRKEQKRRGRSRKEEEEGKGKKRRSMERSIAPGEEGKILCKHCHPQPSKTEG